MANRIRAAQMTVFANDTQLDRLQAFGVTARLDSEDLREIGNLDIVEVLDDVPAVDITLDANQYGSLKTLRKLTQKNFNWATISVDLKNATSVTASAGDYYINEMKYNKATATDVTITAPASANQKRIDVISIDTSGTVTRTAGTPTTGTPAVPATPAGALKLAEVQVNNDALGAAYPLTYLNILQCHDAGTTYLKDFEFCKVDFVCPVKELGDNTTDDPITRTMYVENAYANRYDAAFSVNGLATESWSLESDNKAWFLNTANVIFVDRFPGNGTDVDFELSYPPTQRPNERMTIKVYSFDPATGEYTDYEEVTNYTVDVDDYNVGTITMGAAVANNVVLVVRYPTDGSNVADDDVPFFKRNPDEPQGHPELAGGVKGGQVEVYLSDDMNNMVLRLQSVSISSSLTREALYEIGHKRAYDRSLQFPIPISVTVEALHSDLREFARLCGKDFANVKEITIDEFLKNLDLVVKVYREDDEIRAKSPEIQRHPLKTITVKNLTLTDTGVEVRVEGNATGSFGFQARTQLEVTARV